MFLRALFLAILVAAPACATAQAPSERLYATNFANLIWSRIVTLCPSEAAAHHTIYDTVFPVLQEPLEVTQTEWERTIEIVRLETAALLIDADQQHAVGLTVVGAIAVLDSLKYGAAVLDFYHWGLNEEQRSITQAMLDLWDCLLPDHFVENPSEDVQADPASLLQPVVAAMLQGLCGMEYLVYVRRYLEFEVSTIRPDHSFELSGFIMNEHEDWLDAGNQTDRCEGSEGWQG